MQANATDHHIQAPQSPNIQSNWPQYRLTANPFPYSIFQMTHHHVLLPTYTGGHDISIRSPALTQAFPLLHPRRKLMARGRFSQQPANRITQHTTLIPSPQNLFSLGQRPQTTEQRYPLTGRAHKPRATSTRSKQPFLFLFQPQPAPSAVRTRQAGRAGRSIGPHRTARHHTLARFHSFRLLLKLSRKPRTVGTSTYSTCTIHSPSKHPDRGLGRANGSAMLMLYDTIGWVG